MNQGEMVCKLAFLQQHFLTCSLVSANIFNGPVYNGPVFNIVYEPSSGGPTHLVREFSMSDAHIFTNPCRIHRIGISYHHYSPFGSFLRQSGRAGGLHLSL
jgi:hypothetical protein